MITWHNYYKGIITFSGIMIEVDGINNGTAAQS